MPDSINNWNMASTLKMVPKWMKVFSPVEEEDSIWVRKPIPQNVNTTLDTTKIGIHGVVQTIQWHENILVQSSRSGILPMFFYFERDKVDAEADLTTMQEKMFQETIQEYLTNIGIKWEDNQHNFTTPYDGNTYWHYFDISSEDMRTWYKYWNMESLFNERQGVI
jgi:hypothetical protein